MADRYPVTVRVGTYLREFIYHNNGSTTLDPEKDSILWCLIKQHLSTVAYTESLEALPDGECINILLRSGTSSSMYNIPKNCTIHVNTLYRCYLNPLAQNVIKKHFEKHLKQVFYTYLSGYSCSQDKIKITYAITEFCLEYNITISSELIERLRKDWYRYRLKKKKNPILF